MSGQDSCIKLTSKILEEYIIDDLSISSYGVFVLECGSVILLGAGAIRALGPNQRQSYVVLRPDTIVFTKKNNRDLKEFVVLRPDTIVFTKKNNRDLKEFCISIDTF